MNGALQHKYTKMEDAALRTVMSDSVFITGVIDTYEARHVVTCNLPGTFLHTVIDELVIKWY